MKKHTYHIKGMHCRSCEILIEDNILKISGVSKVNVNHKKGIAEVEFANGQPDSEEIVRAVNNAGYTLGTSAKLHFLSRNPEDYFDLLIGISVLMAIYLFAKITGITDAIGTSFAGSPTYPIVLLIGLTAGVSTCMAVVDGLVTGFSASYAESHQYATRWERFKPNIWFNTGRLVSYALLGGAIGAFGSVAKLSTETTGFLIAAAGVVMLYIGLKLTGISPKISNSSIPFPKKIGRVLGITDSSGEYSNRGAFIGGALTFFLPCGFTQAMQIYAITTGSFVSGAAIMFLFALGTMSGLLGIGAITSVLQGGAAKIFFRFVGVAMVALGIFNISNGYNLSGFVIPSFGSAGQETAAQLPPVENGEQIVNMDQLAGGYDPNRFTVKKDIPVKWIVNSKSSYTCASSLRMPAFRISQFLEAGENILRFTPTETGTFRFACSMGMYSGIFTVIN